MCVCVYVCVCVLARVFCDCCFGGVFAMSSVWLKGGSGLWELRAPVSANWQRRLMRRRRAAGSRGNWRRGDYVLLDIGTDGSVGHSLPAIDRDVLALLMELCFFPK